MLPILLSVFSLFQTAQVLQLNAPVQVKESEVKVDKPKTHPDKQKEQEAKAQNKAVFDGCGADRYEPNDKRGRAKSMRGKPVEAISCHGDTDWFRYDFKEGQEIQIKLEHQQPCELSLFAPRRRKPVGESLLNPEWSAVKLKVEKSGRYRFRVQCPQKSPNSYRLQVEISKGL